MFSLAAGNQRILDDSRWLHRALVFLIVEDGNQRCAASPQVTRMRSHPETCFPIHCVTDRQPAEIGRGTKEGLMGVSKPLAQYI